MLSWFAFPPKFLSSGKGQTCFLLVRSFIITLLYKGWLKRVFVWFPRIVWFLSLFFIYTNFNKKYQREDFFFFRWNYIGTHWFFFPQIFFFNKIFFLQAMITSWVNLALWKIVPITIIKCTFGAKWVLSAWSLYMASSTVTIWILVPLPNRGNTAYIMSDIGTSTSMVQC